MIFWFLIPPVLFFWMVPSAAPAPTTYVWGGAESRAMTAVRRYVRHEVGLAREQVDLVPYWRHQAHAADPVDPEE